MRWEQLFDDLEAQLEADTHRERVLEVADRTRRERSLLGLHERLVAHRGRSLELRLVAGQVVAGKVTDVGEGWVLVRDRPRYAGLVPFAAIAQISGMGADVAAGRSVVRSRRFGLSFALRALSRDRAVVSLGDIAGRLTTGTIDAVGADVLDLSEHPADLPRRAENVIARRVVPFSAIAVVRNV